MNDLLFSPLGTIGRDTFKRGAVILLAANFFLWPLWWFGMGMGMLGGFLALCLIYCWYCLFSKRLRASHRSPVLFIPILLTFMIVSYILATILWIAFVPDLAERLEEIQALNPNDPANMEALIAMHESMMRDLFAPSAAAFFIVGYAVAFGVNNALPLSGDTE